VRVRAPTVAAHRPLPAVCMRDAEELNPLVDDPFEILGVPHTATRDDIRRAYRRRARVVHPDVSDDPESPYIFRKLVMAFELLEDNSKRSSFETRRKRSSARARAQRQWEDVVGNHNKGGRRPRRTGSSTATSNYRSSSGDGSSASAQARAASRRRASERVREAEPVPKRRSEDSERRRRRGREESFEEILRARMPREYEPASAQHRDAFVAAMERAVQAFVESSSSSRVGGGRDPEASETAELERLANCDILHCELGDARHRSRKHRERVRWLERELESATKRSGMWRSLRTNASSFIAADDVEALQSELDFLQLARRLRERISEQHEALRRLDARETALVDRLSELEEREGPPGASRPRSSQHRSRGR
jgi:curved DNA-binding protein CbpA